MPAIEGRSVYTEDTESRAVYEGAHRAQMHTLPTPNANDLLAYRHKVPAISDRLYVAYS